MTVLKNQDGEFTFATVGHNTFKLWKVDSEGELLFFDVDLPEELTLTSIENTEYISAPYNASLFLIGDSEGHVLVVNSATLEFLAKVDVFDCEIGLIKANSTSILICNENGNVFNSPINAGKDLFSEKGTCIELDSPAVAIFFDKVFNEGVIGTMSGSVRYVNWDEGTNI